MKLVYYKTIVKSSFYLFFSKILKNKYIAVKVYIHFSVHCVQSCHKIPVLPVTPAEKPPPCLVSLWQPMSRAIGKQSLTRLIVLLSAWVRAFTWLMTPRPFGGLYVGWLPWTWSSCHLPLSVPCLCLPRAMCSLEPWDHCLSSKPHTAVCVVGGLWVLSR